MRTKLASCRQTQYCADASVLDEKLDTAASEKLMMSVGIVNQGEEQRGNDLSFKISVSKAYIFLWYNFKHHSAP